MSRINTAAAAAATATAAAAASAPAGQRFLGLLLGAAYSFSLPLHFHHSLAYPIISRAYKPPAPLARGRARPAARVPALPLLKAPLQLVRVSAASGEPKRSLVMPIARPAHRAAVGVGARLLEDIQVSGPAQALGVQMEDEPAPRAEAELTTAARDVTEQDERGIEGAGMVSDTVMCAYMAYVQTSKLASDILIMSTFFYTKLEKNAGRIEALDSWTLGVDYTKTPTVLVPIHVNGNHWILAVIRMLGEHSIEFYDSLGCRYITIAKTLEAWARRALDRARLAVPARFAVAFPDVPDQGISLDCAIYVMLFADHIVQTPGHATPRSFSITPASVSQKRVSVLALVRELKAWARAGVTLLAARSPSPVVFRF